MGSHSSTVLEVRMARTEAMERAAFFSGGVRAEPVSGLAAQFLVAALIPCQASHGWSSLLPSLPSDGSCHHFFSSEGIFLLPFFYCKQPVN